MKIIVFLLGVITLSTTVHSAIVAVEADFVVDCGTDSGPGMVSITYTNSDPANNNVASMSSPKGLPTCSTSTVTATSQLVISDARNNCDIAQPDPNKPEYFLQITLQEVVGVYLQTDPSFVFKCAYSVSEVPVSTVIEDAGNVGVPTIVEVSAVGNPDMTYGLQLVDQTQTLLTEAKFGDDIILQVTMSGTDADEQGVKVKSCVAKSGSISLPIIEDFCVVPGKEALFLLTGFTSSGTVASFPMKVFALEGSSVPRVEFECVAEVCPSACPGSNCPAAGKRKRRASGSEPESTEEKVITMVTRLQIIPESGYVSGQAGTAAPSSATCMQSLGFIVTVGVLAVLLLVAMVAVIFMLTTRRRELQKQGA